MYNRPENSCDMKVICYCCDEEIDFTDDLVAVEFVSDHPFIAIDISVRCPRCHELEEQTITLDVFLQERGIE
jgi:hypothetical protein